MNDSSRVSDPPASGDAAEATAYLDARGLKCPEPLMMVRNWVRELPSGAVLKVDATDPSTTRDLSNFCRFMGHELIDHREASDLLQFWIRKG